MANFDEIGEYGLGQILAKRLTTPGGAVAPTVAPELFPCVVLESDRPEWVHLSNGGLFSVRMFLAAVAGQYGMLQLYIPSTAKALAVVEAVRLNAGGTAVAIARGVGISAGLAGWTGRATASRDFRSRQEGSAAILESNTNAVAPTIYTQLHSLEGANYIFDNPIVIAPGTTLILWGLTVNVALNVTITWRERMAQPGELV